MTVFNSLGFDLTIRVIHHETPTFHGLQNTVTDIHDIFRIPDVR